MAGYQDLSEFELGVIGGAREMGHSISDVVMQFGFPRTTISRVYREYRESDINAGQSTSVALQTIKRNIIDMGFRSRKLTRVALLTDRHKALRLAWTLQHRHWTVDDWKHFDCYNESRLQLNRADGRVRA
ncbi:HTH_Tnp_Tc3_2 domain-containing protein [Trichonephila clavipes]|nr:HTH_Tnp_Tc3_2 domain-containing protein [Trichonephila clavipes]